MTTDIPPQRPLDLDAIRAAAAHLKSVMGNTPGIPDAWWIGEVNRVATILGADELLAEVTALRAELDAARAERTEPATGEDVAVVVKVLWDWMYANNAVPTHQLPTREFADTLLAALDLPALRAALGEAREEVQRLTVAIDHCDIERDKERASCSTARPKASPT